MMPRVLIVAFCVVALFAIVAGAAPVYQGYPQRGELAAAGVTGSTGGSAKLLITLGQPATCLAIENTMTVEVMITRGTTDLKRVPASSFRVIDFGANSASLPPGATINVYPTGATGSTGYVEAVACSSPR